MERYRVIEMLSFLGSDVHKSFSPLFNPAMPEEGKAVYRTRLRQRYEWIETQLEGREYLMGAEFSVADAYLFTVTGWCQYVGVEISDLPRLKAYQARVAARPAVQEAMKAEGLLK